MSADPLSESALSLLAAEEAPALVLHQHTLNETPQADFFLGGASGAFLESEPAVNPHGDADFWFTADTQLDTDLDHRIEQTLAEANNLTGQTQVVSKYGFTGVGQTVAVIDTGIAYSHYALGGGLGAGYRVVGGWDFTEGDADFYDEGPQGGHGTHVAGIVGADNPNGAHSGVATGVDLVGLRVFDDAGAGRMSWVENALRWVITNRTTFTNPITAINLSLGVEWNSESTPTWAMLEDEFATLEAAGVFISVSAGNSYTSYNTPGLSYPASSDHVVPVMSTDNNGNLSYFSQRSQSAIAAPGRTITSTVPDYLGNDADTLDDDWVSMSGTSMAAPYVAGASVLVREAMQFAGWAGIDQWDIFNHMMSTADTFYDSASQANYKRLNLEAAIDAIMPADDYGSTVETAYSLGTVTANGAQTQSILSGAITTLTDADYFTFTAGSTGTVTFTASGLTHNLQANWTGIGGNGWTESSGDAYTMEVSAGQTYSIAIASSGGLGYYSLSVAAESISPYPTWGVLASQQTISNVAVAGESWYRVTAGRSGLFTAEVLQGGGQIAIYDGQQSLIAEVSQPGGAQRYDALVTAGQEYHVRVWGVADPTSVRLTNALTFNSGVDMSLFGTDANDSVTFTAGSSTNTVSLNGVAYTLAGSGTTVRFTGNVNQQDVVTINAGSGNELFTLGKGYAVAESSQGWSFYAIGVAQTTANAGTGSDYVSLYDTTGNDNLVAWTDRVVMYGNGYVNEARGFDGAYSYANAGGNDVATFYDGAGADYLIAWTDRVLMYGTGYHNEARGFEATFTHSTAGGDDVATLYDSAGNDQYIAWNDRVVMSGNGYSNDVRGFGATYANATNGGNDVATLYDTSGNDYVVAWSSRVVMYGTGYMNDARGFDSSYSHATAGGVDVITYYDTAGNDNFTAWSGGSVMYGTGYTNVGWGFEANYASATAGGRDIATMYDTQGNDYFVGWSDRVVLYGTGYFNDARGFDETYTHATAGGTDVATLYDTAGNDTLHAWSNRAVLSGTGYANDVRGFDATYTNATAGGLDTATLYDSTGNDTYVAWKDRVVLYGTGFFNDARGFDSTVTYATSGGLDVATLYDSAGDDQYKAWSDRVVMEGGGYSNQARGFDATYAHSIAGGSDVATFEDSAGADTFVAGADRATLYGPGYYNDSYGFASTIANATRGGQDTATLNGTSGNDIFRGWSNRSQMIGTGYSNEAQGFKSVIANAGAGDDEAYLYDSVGADKFYAWSARSLLTGSGFSNDARGFDRTVASSSAGGADTATFYGSTSPNESLINNAPIAEATGDTYSARAEGFAAIYADQRQGAFELIGGTARDRVFAAI
ncbi:Subtilisin DY [Botrimarina hoheduenensis]|uniref:Subtilisin DY n=2 Tax=Botrimarina hoheduenensis TaxID=2528000 RepID=A0A5C5VRL7_9BACT|nr:Subtilisin DY [Botrimarina hoheduenensis]